MNRLQSRGFTLIEVLIALVIGSIVVLLTHQLFSTVSEGIRRLDSARIQLDTKQLGDRWLEAAFLSLEAGDKAGPFEGHPDNVRFTTWVMQPGGWMERRQVRLAVGDSSLMAASDGDILPLQHGVIRVDFDYLLDPGAQSHWVQEWVSPVSAPLAIRIRLSRQGAVDTMLLLIKARG